MNMNWLKHFAQELTKGHEAEPWHGPSTKSMLRGITAEEAASHVIPEFHSIWEIVLHIDAWQREVFRRLDSSFIPEIPEEGDWRTVLEVSEEAWQQAISDLDSSLHELISALNNIAKTADENKALESRGTASGPAITLAATLSGLIQHNAYHSGQIAMLQKALRAER
jgi:uncharacterized damage-inducible protein DinB